jgi:hypothetical protein
VLDTLLARAVERAREYWKKAAPAISGVKGGEDE